MKKSKVILCLSVLALSLLCFSCNEAEENINPGDTDDSEISQEYSDYFRINTTLSKYEKDIEAQCVVDEKTVVPKIELCFLDAHGLTLRGSALCEEEAGSYMIERIKYGEHDIECSHEMWLTDRLFGIESADGITVVWNHTIDESVPLHYYIFAEGADEYSYISNNISADGYELRIYAENGKISYTKQNYDYAIVKIQSIGSLIDAFEGDSEFFRERGKVVYDGGEISFITELVWTADDWYHSDEFPFPGPREDYGCSTLADFVDACRQEQNGPSIPDSPETTAVVNDKTPALNSKLVYLTFDDGPGKYTEQVLEILDEYGVTATFFMVGEYMGYQPERVKAVYEAGHLIGCHSTKHAYNEIYQNNDTISADIKEWEKIISWAIGYVPEERVYRFPGGSNCSAISNQKFPELHEAVNECGYRAFDWTFSNNDLYYADKREDESLHDYMKRSLILSYRIGGQPKILLVHETVAETVEMLPWIIEYMRGEGYEFAPISMLDGEFLFAH